MKEHGGGVDYSQFFQKKILVIFIMIFFIVLGIYLYSPFFPLRDIEIVGNSSFTAEQLVTKGEIDTTKNIYLINNSHIEKKIMEDSYVQKVRVKKKFPRSLLVEIYERKPVATINFQGGFALIDEDSNVLKIEQNFSGSVKPLIIGSDIKELKVGEKLNSDDRKLGAIIKLVKNIQGLGIVQSITQISVAEPSDINLLTTQGITVLLGDGSDMNEKLLRLNQILVDLQTKGINSGYVDMRFDAYPVYRS
ncbi:MAG: cell division protein FtsQ/DivIB [Filifactoraceae bacterium]